MRLAKKKSRKAFLLSSDAFFALTLALVLSLSVAVFSQAPRPHLVQLHQLGRDYLVLTQKQGISFDFKELTGFNSTTLPSNVVASKIIAYPKLCDSPSSPACFAQQDTLGKTLVFNATVSP